MKEKYAAVIFDLDGTLLDTLGDLYEAVNHALSIYQYPLKSLEEVRLAVGNGVGKLIERVIPDGIKNPNYEACLVVFREYYSVHMQDRTAPYPGILEVLSVLKEQGYNLGIVSNKFDAAVKMLKEEYFAEIISVAIGESQEVKKKPAPDSVFKAMEELKCTRETAVYVGDSDVDVATAHNAGLKCIGVTWGFRDEELLRQAGADWIIHNPLELLEIV